VIIIVLQCAIFEEYDCDKLQNEVNDFLSENEIIGDDIFNIKTIIANDEEGKNLYIVVIYYEIELE